MNMLRRGVEQNPDNFSRRENKNNQSGEMFRTFKDMMSPQIKNKTESMINSGKNSPIFRPLIEGYEKVKNILPEVDLNNQRISKYYEKEMGPGIFSLGGDYDYGNSGFNLGGQYSMSFEDGGMVEERQRQRQTPLSRIENPGSNAMDNYYGFDRGLDVRNPQDLRRQQDAQAMNNPHHPIHANRTDYRAQGYNSLGQLQNYPSRRNMRGKDNYRVNVGPTPEGDTTGLGGLINRLDTGNKGYGYMLNRVFGLPFDQELIDWQDKYGDDYNAYTGNSKGSRGEISSERQPGFDDGGIATLPEGKTEEPGMQKPKVPMTDEQKDYLFDYMMDFMMKQRAREQQEMEGRIPPFNYEGLEV